jgi:2-methylcitrate dehydratase PrpD
MAGTMTAQVVSPEAVAPGATAELARMLTECTGCGTPEVVRRMQMLLLDQLGCQIAGSALPWSKQISRVIGSISGQGQATVVQSAQLLAPDAAAFINSTLGHSNESDDTHLKSPTHPGAVVIPAAIAVAEHTGASGAELIEALIHGYEVMLRVSASVSPHLIARGHHPPVGVGPFGAAAAAGTLMKLDYEQMLNALAVSGSFSAGIQEYTQTGGSVKRLHCAIPAQAGVRSVLLAQAGVTGPPTVLEGERGFCKVFAGEFDLDRLTSGFGTEFLTMETAFKTYSCCYLIHPALDAIRALVADGLAVEDVESIEVLTHLASLVHHVGTIVEPQDILAAQFSMSFSIALMLVEGDCGYWDFFNADLHDAGLLDLAHRVTTRVGEPDTDRFNTELEVRVTTRDGQVLTKTVRYARGEPEVPLSDAEIQDKFRKMSTPVLGAERVEEVIALVDRLPELESISELTERLVGDVL